MRFELFIAWRYLTARRREKFISLISFISVAGVAVGVAALIVVLSVMAGFDNDLKEKIIGINPHILVEKTSGMPQLDSAIDKIAPMEDVLCVSPYINGQVILKTSDLTIGALVRGMDMQENGSVLKIKDYLVKGKLPEAEKDIVIGKELANMLNLDLAGKLTVISPFDSKKYEFSVSGIFACGMYDYDANVAFMSLKDAQQIFVMPELITGIGVRLKDPYKAEAFARHLRAELNYMYTVRSWADLNRNFFNALKLEKTTMFIILTLIVIVACFNIASTLIMMVLEKTKDIGILKAIGATNTAVRIIFTLEGIVIGVMGTAFGMAMGLGLCELLKKYQFIQLPKEIYYIDRLPVRVQSSDVMLISAAAIIISLLATVYPAWQASRLDPVEALRYE